MAFAEQEVATELGGGRARIARWIGGALFALGLVGLAVPILPTVPFWILALIVLGRSDPALSARIRSWPGVGPTIAEFVDHGVIGRRAKIGALLGVAASAVLATVVVGPGWPLVAALALMAAGALYVATRPTRRSDAA